MEPSTTPGTPEMEVPKQEKQSLAIPVAIVIAGAFIAGAIYMSGGSQEKQAGTENQEAPAQIVIEPINENDHYLGDLNAEIVFVEYSDFQCPFCKRFHDTMKQVMEEYGKQGKVAWVYRHLPLDQIHPNARPLAEASECVASVGGNAKFWEFADLIFAEEDSSTLDPVTTAKSIGVDIATCYNAKTFASKVEAQAQDAAKAGARGTPYSVVVFKKDGNNYPLSGAQPYTVVKQAIDSLLTQ